MTSIRVLVVVGALALIAGCSRAHSDVGLFSLRAIPLELDSRWELPVRSLQSGTVAGLLSSGGVKLENITVTRFVIGRNKLTRSLSVPRTGVQPIPELLLSDDRLLTRRRGSAKEGTPGYWSRSNVVFELYDPASDKVRDVTPSNLDETTRWLCRSGPPMLWTERFGIALFIPDPDSREVRLWQGRETLELVQRVSSALGVGDTFVSGVLSAVVVTENGEAFGYDYSTGKMKELPQLQPIASRLANAAAKPEKWPLSFVMAEGVAAFKWRQGREFVLIASDGSRQALMVHHPFEEKPSGSTRSREEGEALSMDASPLKREARSQPPEVVNVGSALLAVDETHVGLFDLLYQRLIVVGPPEGTREE